MMKNVKCSLGIMQERTQFFKIIFRGVHGQTHFETIEFNRNIHDQCGVSGKNVGRAWDPRGPWLGLIPVNLNCQVTQTHRI